MKIRKLLLTLVASSTLFTLGSKAASVNAATWHKGTPSKLRGYWKSDGNLISFQKKAAAFLMKNATSALSFSNPIYKSTGHNKYIIKTSNNSYNNGGKVSGSWYNVTYSKNHTHIKYDGKSYGYFHHSNTID